MKVFSRNLILLFLAFLWINTTHAQVGINTENPFAQAELDIRNVVINNDTVPKGILIPKMTKSLRDQIDVTSVSDVNGLVIYNSDDDCYNYYSKTEASWRSLCGAQGKAQFDPVDCSAISVNGAYVEGVELDDSNYLSVKLNITKTGSYNISAVTTNGYYFRTEGVALITGSLVLNIPSYGTPFSEGVDNLQISGLKFADPSCTPTVKVQPQVATYSINCSNIAVNGSYYKNRLLTAANTIQVGINVGSIGSYSILTETKNGVYFAATGKFTTTGLVYVTLQGYGTPTINQDFDVKILTNSPTGLSECTTTIPITLPAMTYGVIGSGDYSWAGPTRSTAISINKQVFSPTGILKIDSFTQLWVSNGGDQATGYLKNGYNGKFPDVVLYFSYGSTANAALGSQLADYIKKGGCVIYGTRDNTPSEANTIMTGIFGSAYATADQMSNLTNDVGQDIYPLANIPNDPILNGPFGSASGQYWGEDNQGTVVIKKLPPNSIQLATAWNPVYKSTLDPSYSVLWYNNMYNFVYFGDSVAASTTDTTTYYYPGYYPTYYPMSKLFGRTGGLGTYQRYIYNSIVELNAVAWCIKKAAVSGINPY